MPANNPLVNRVFKDFSGSYFYWERAEGEQMLPLSWQFSRG